jgi:hypothetical protein
MAEKIHYSNNHHRQDSDLFSKTRPLNSEQPDQDSYFYGLSLDGLSAKTRRLDELHNELIKDWDHVKDLDCISLSHSQYQRIVGVGHIKHIASGIWVPKEKTVDYKLENKSTKYHLLVSRITIKPLAQIGRKEIEQSGLSQDEFGQLYGLKMAFKPYSPATLIDLKV